MLRAFCRGITRSCSSSTVRSLLQGRRRLICWTRIIYDIIRHVITLCSTQWVLSEWWWGGGSIWLSSDISALTPKEAILKISLTVHRNQRKFSNTPFSFLISLLFWLRIYSQCVQRFVAPSGLKGPLSHAHRHRPGSCDVKTKIRIKRLAQIT